MQRSLFIGAVLASTFFGCGDDDDDNETAGDASSLGDSGTRDAGLDGGRDGGADGGMDAARDAASDTGPGDTGTTVTDSGSPTGTDGAAADAGADGAAADAGTDSAVADAGAESFAAIYSTLIMPTCTGSNCHDSSNPAGNLDMSSAADAYDNLVGQDADGPECGSSNLDRVVAGNAAMSLLIQVLEGTQTCGARMPLNGTPLSADQIARIRRWIDQGAEDN